MKSIRKAWKKLSSRERRYITIAVVIGVIYILVNYVYDPLYAAYESMNSELKVQSNLLQRSEHLIRNSDKIRERLRKAIIMDQSIDSVLLSSQTTDLANAELQGLVKTLAQKADITFTTINSNKVIEKDGFLELGVSVVFTAQIQQIERFVFELETAAQFLYIQELTIKSQRRNRNNLQVDMDITGFIRNAEPFVATDETKEKSRKLDT